MRFFGAFNSRFSVNVYASATVSGDVSPNSRCCCVIRLVGIKQIPSFLRIMSD